ncbi:MAG: hypothetical protein U9Q83_11215 [Bacteroidota bacterium]|nr:hypothetical protein [Bacteroidota bacterium]
MAWKLFNKGTEVKTRYKTKASAQKARDRAVERSKKNACFEKQKKTDYKIQKTTKL